MVRLSPSISPRQNDNCHLRVENLRFLVNGPYTFTIRRRECVGLSGKSGIGKTQLLRAITDLIPHTGLVSLDGVSSTALSAPVWRSRVTMIPAEPLWWYPAVGDHFSTDLYPGSFEENLDAVGFSEDVLQWQVTRLSTGEKQRLALVRGLCNAPSVLLLDEPCSSLDGYHTTLVENFILKYLQHNSASILWVSHDPEQLQRVTERELCMEKNLLTEKTLDL
jgi:ABC-type iron transport system FetAB ATPase subunit